MSFFYVDAGDVSINGELVYIIDIPFNLSDGQTMHVFDFASGWRVQKSTHGSGHFDFDVSWELVDAPTYASGMTFWDLEGTGSPHRGHLHVIIIDTDDFSGDDVSIKHYSRNIRVDPDLADPSRQYGTPTYPFRTVGQALDLSWSGAEIRIRAGHYDERTAMSKRIRITAEGGTVRIGD